jgi:hypothetical protein
LVSLWSWTLWITATPALAAAESLPASVRACAGETDSLKRLVCYDREVARYMDVKPDGSKPTTKHEPASNPATDVAAAAGTTTAAAVPAPQQAQPAAAAPTDSTHVAARVVSIDHVPNEMVLHLDNGQVWQQQQSVPGDLSLRVGDTIKIDKRLGTYWLTGPHVSGMKVRQKI